MEQREISLADRLDAGVAISAMRRHERLWRTAEGRGRWTDGIAALLSLLLVAIGFIQLGRNQSFREVLDLNEGLGFVLLGVVLLGSFFWSRTQRQLSALREIVRELERESRRG